jgi:mannose-6-phosphate isomerase-like protein (cupin superfamily)
MPKTILSDPIEYPLRNYMSEPIFQSRQNWEMQNPYNRPLRLVDLDFEDTLTPIQLNQLCSNRSLILNRTLFNIYEQSMLFLPRKEFFSQCLSDFKNFYDRNLVALGESIRPELERRIFSALESAIEVGAGWNANHLKEYFNQIIISQQKPSKLNQILLSSQNPQRAAKFYLLQMAPDFLAEASAMGRFLTGNYGVAQSELMKIFIDEYGYGVHNTKHSTLFEKTLESVELSSEINRYYNYYLPTSLLLANYFHYICSNKIMWFKYIGALFYTEASIPFANQELSRTLKLIFSTNVDTHYFDEHVHIDIHHRNMVMENLILPAITLYGESIIPEIIAGFEEFRILQELADQDVISQINFIDQLDHPLNSSDISQFKSSIIGESKIFTEKAETLSVTHIHDQDELFSVLEGRLEFSAATPWPIELEAGQSIRIPAGRLHGTRALSEICIYQVQTLKPRACEKNHD